MKKRKQSWQRVYKQQPSASKNTSASNHSWPHVWAEVSLVSLFWVPLFKHSFIICYRSSKNVVLHRQTQCMNALNTTVLKKLAHAALWNDLEASTTLLIPCFSLLVKQLIAHKFVLQSQLLRCSSAHTISVFFYLKMTRFLYSQLRTFSQLHD